jgi:hypothetical protein
MTDLPSYFLGTTGPTGKIHLFDGNFAECSTLTRPVVVSTKVVDIPLGAMTKAGLTEIVARLSLDAGRFCGRCFSRELRDAVRPSIL